MKTIGIIGGLSPESTMKYYQWINEGVRAELGGLHSARIMLASVDFAEFTDLKENGDWDTQARILAQQAQALERAGADFILLATNTMHRVADVIEDAISVPFLHLADVTARAITAQGMETVGLLGTRYTMELDFYKGRLKDHGVMTLVPDEAGREIVNRTIYEELCGGQVNDNSRAAFRKIIAELAEAGAQGIILGCTELTMLVRPEDSPVPLFDTTKIHVEEAVKQAFLQAGTSKAPSLFPHCRS